MENSSNQQWACRHNSAKKEMSLFCHPYEVRVCFLEDKVKILKGEFELSSCLIDSTYTLLDFERLLSKIEEIVELQNN